MNLEEKKINKKELYENREIKFCMFMKRILCFLGLHDWEYIFENRIFPFTPYECCKRCGKIKLI